MAAIVDWEMATIGDPLLDLAWVLMSWPDPGEDRNSGYVDYSDMPSRDELTHRYALASGLPVDAIDYYIVLARFTVHDSGQSNECRVRRHPGGLRHSGYRNPSSRD